MPKGRFLTTSPLVAAAAVVAGAGLFTTAAPAQALPPAPLAPAACGQWGFPGPVTIRRDTGETVNFTANGPNAGAPADWDHQQGKVDHGNISGNIGPDGVVSLTFFQNDGTAIPLNGQVGPDGKATGMSPPDNSVAWHTVAPLTCVTQAAAVAKEGPSISLDPGLGALTIHVTDHSGVASNCQYHSDFVNRTFDLPANGTFDINVVPAVPLFIDHQVDITCTNGTSTHTTAFF